MRGAKQYVGVGSRQDWKHGIRGNGAGLVWVRGDGQWAMGNGRPSQYIGNTLGSEHG